MRRIAAVVTALALALPAGEASAWGATGHRLIAQAAAERFSPELPTFLRSRTVPGDLGELAREADRWKGLGQPHDAMREGYHFIDLDDAGRVLGGPTLAELPVAMKDYEAALAAVGADRWEAGWLPYALVDAHQQLTVDFGLWRAARAGERFAKTREKRAWFKRDRERREALILRDIGIYGHWIGDATQPHHTSIHYNGWAKDAPNPQGYTRERVHSRFEGDFVRDSVALADVRAAVRAERVCEDVVRACAARLITETNAQVTTFYALEKAGGFAAGDPRGKAFVAERLGAGAAWMRDLVETAWRESADIKVGWYPISVREVEAGRIDPYPALLGRD